MSDDLFVFLIGAPAGIIFIIVHVWLEKTNQRLFEGVKHLIGRVRVKIKVFHPIQRVAVRWSLMIVNGHQTGTAPSVFLLWLAVIIIRNLAKT